MVRCSVISNKKVIKILLNLMPSLASTKKLLIIERKYIFLSKKYYFYIILVLKVMFTHNYRNRFDMNHTTTNILMTQIRAEKTLYASKNTQAQSSRREEFRGKKVFHDILNRPSLSPTARENRSNACKDTQRGKLMLM